MLSEEKIRELSFNGYNDFIIYCKSLHKDIIHLGLCHEEIVNEAIINVFDCKNGFEKEENLIQFIKTSIKTIGYHEKSLLKDNKFYTKSGKENEEYSNIDKKTQADNPSDDFLKIYNKFSNARFGNNLEYFKCRKCHFNKFYVLENGLLACKNCSFRHSITSGTYINNLKLKYSQLYKLIVWVCKPQKISSYNLARLINITQVTAWKKRHLILSVIIYLGKQDVYSILEKVLTEKILDLKPIKLIPTNKRRKFSFQDVMEIRRLINEGVLNATEVAELYEHDPSGIRKIAKGLLYKKY